MEIGIAETRSRFSFLAAAVYVSVGAVPPTYIRRRQTANLEMKNAVLSRTVSYFLT